MWLLVVRPSAVSPGGVQPQLLSIPVPTAQHAAGVTGLERNLRDGVGQEMPGLAPSIPAPMPSSKPGPANRAAEGRPLVTLEPDNPELPVRQC